MTSPSRGTGGPGPRGQALLLRYWLPLLAYIALIFSGSSVHGDAIPSLFPNMDKVAHLMEYSLLGLLIGRALRATFDSLSPVIFTFATVGLGGMVGLADELYQGHVPGRSRDPFDWLTDLSALALASLIAQYIHRRPRRDANSATKPGR
ncbi:MAG: VanZ family protein [Candidatus Eiseniibacteriota bacterium]